ncbi:transcriptional regulator PpsR [Sphingomonas ginsenosidivorax]|uniref:Transcriptional regulator PpsR n=1 Tax=Sphingomonas ginsenosidivorax TaxID=862135 RepID=A0A5C6UFX8_9SPHN|nr:transcriptional regulator PpsR [Sphingomonas ginsenosidivorax]TXC71161.1 transcriptional regulator PpsR [Sphingomonas ginsenosidivorax]
MTKLIASSSVAASAVTAFTKPDVVPGVLSAGTAASLLAAVGDLAFILSADGTVLDVAVSHGDLAHHGFADMVGGPWADTMTVESRAKVAEMLEAATTGAAPRWRQINHAVAGGDVPIRYIVMTLGQDDRLIAIGRDLRAAAAMQQRLLQTQQSLERDYIRLRQAETRYRLLFDTATDAVLIVDAETRRIREANPAAHALLDAADGALVGNTVNTIVDPASRDDLIAHLGAAEAADDVAPILVPLGARRAEARLSARLFRQARQPLLIVRIEFVESTEPTNRYEATLSEVVERMPDAFVLVDRELQILTANAAFIELAEMPSIERVIGVRLGSWLGRPGIDLELIVAQLREHGAVRNVATILRGTAGAQAEIEVSGVVAPMAGNDCYGFTIRHVGRRLRQPPIVSNDTPRSVEQLTELVGRMSLKEIVRESTDLIERLCIEAALAYTSDNRASAAEVLGVSRQSLYSKLHRHGLGNLVSGDS